MNYKRGIALLFSIKIAFSVNVSAQNSISGHITDSLNAPVSNVSVTYGSLKNIGITGYTQTDNEGNFKIAINISDDSIILKLNHISYIGQVHHLLNKTAAYTFRLSATAALLKEVVIKQPPIYKINDTINYNVNAFTSKQDKVIGDVIKKLPGIEVENGQIRYQGKPIQEYLINGLNLLDEKYQLANNNLPAGDVLNVQIIQNHQPIKVLDSIIFSERASLNLQLKKFTTTGSGKVSVGTSPFLRDINLTPMTFTKSFQALNTFQSNNVGNNVAADLYTSTSMAKTPILGEPNTSLPKQDFLSIPNVPPPPFGQERWLNNDINLVSANVIKKLTSETELKANLSYYNDHTIQRGVNLTEMFIPGQIIFISEAIDNGVNTNDLAAGFSLIKNVRSSYTKNDFKAAFQRKQFAGSILRNDTDHIAQVKKIDGLNFYNNFSSISKLGSQLISFNSIINYYENPQSLTVVPGQFDSLLNSGFKYAQVAQDVKFKNLDIDNSLSIIKGIKRFSIASKLGLKYLDQKLESDISTLYNLHENQLGNAFQNNIRFNIWDAYLDFLAQYNTARLKVELALPSKIRTMSINHDRELQRLVVEPKFLVRYKLSPQLDITASSRFNNRFGGIEQLYGGYILNTYNSLQRFNNSVTESKILETYMSLNYTNTTTSVFANLFMDNKKQFRDFLFVDNVDASGMKTIDIINQVNNVSTTYFAGDVGKYIANMRTTLKTKGTMAYNDLDQMINGTMSNIHQRDYSIGLSVNNSSMSFLNASYDGSIHFIHSQSAGKNLNDIINQSHRFNIGIVPFKNHMIVLKADYYSSNRPAQPHQTFIDMEYRFSLVRGKVNLEVKATNLLDKNRFTSQYISSYSYVANDYQLRPRQFLIGTWFKF